MNTKKTCLFTCAFLAALTLVVTPAAAEDDAKALAEKGSALLTKGDFDGAIAAYKAAAKADKENPEYLMQYSLLNRVVKVRKKLLKENDPKTWQRLAFALHSFYHNNEIYTEALPLDRQIHERLQNAESATMLAETQLALGMNAETETLLTELGKKATSRTRVLLGVASARLDKMKEAKIVAAMCRIEDDMGPGALFDLASLRALVGDNPGALEALTKCFEQTPPSLLDTYKTYAKECKDLKSIQETDGFAKAMKTESKIKESKCSGGAGCGKCPHRSGCSKTKKSGGCSDKKTEGCSDKKTEDKPEKKPAEHKPAEHKHGEGCSHDH